MSDDDYMREVWTLGRVIVDFSTKYYKVIMKGMHSLSHSLDELVKRMLNEDPHSCMALCPLPPS